MTQRSPEEEAIYQRVREEIAVNLYERTMVARGVGRLKLTLLSKETQETWCEEADQILSIKLGSRTLKEWIELYEKGKLAILADDQTLPEHHLSSDLSDTGLARAIAEDELLTIQETQQEMLQAGFRKVIKLEGK